MRAALRSRNVSAWTPRGRGGRRTLHSRRGFGVAQHRPATPQPPQPLPTVHTCGAAGWRERLRRGPGVSHLATEPRGLRRGHSWHRPKRERRPGPGEWLARVLGCPCLAPPAGQGCGGCRMAGPRGWGSPALPAGRSRLRGLGNSSRIRAPLSPGQAGGDRRQLFRAEPWSGCAPVRAFLPSVGAGCTSPPGSCSAPERRVR